MSNMERRQHRRVPAQLQGFLLGNSHEIEAVTLDVSVGGARFDCDIEVYPGKVIRVRLVIPGAVLFTLGIQIFFASFFISILDTKTKSTPS